MGVINITPDSFSDGAKFNAPESFAQAFNKSSQSFNIIDIGAESTAPMNDAISVDEEIARYNEIFLPLLKSIPAPSCKLSFDTYKPEVFKYLLSMVRKHWGSDFPIMFNDVSGKIDNELIELLKNEKFTYVFCHNLCDHRDQTSNHMDFVQDLGSEGFLKNISDYFQTGSKVLNDLSADVIIDPSFGFSKTRSQNHLLLARIGEVFNPFNKQVMVGISRKSFLRDKAISTSDSSLDVAQGVLLGYAKSQLDRPPVFRVHDHVSLSGLDISDQILSHCQKV